MMDAIYKLFVNFCAEQKAQNKEIYGLKIYPGESVEWCIENYDDLVIAEGNATLNSCLKFLTQNTKNHEADSTYTASSAMVYELWQRYYPVHQRVHKNEEFETFPYLLFHPDHYVSIQDLESDIEWHGKLEEAIALLNFCINSECSFAQVPR